MLNNDDEDIVTASYRPVKNSQQAPMDVDAMDKRLAEIRAMRRAEAAQNQTTKQSAPAINRTEPIKVQTESKKKSQDIPESTPKVLKSIEVADDEDDSEDEDYDAPRPARSSRQAVIQESQRTGPGRERTRGNVGRNSYDPIARPNRRGMDDTYVRRNTYDTEPKQSILGRISNFFGGLFKKGADKSMPGFNSSAGRSTPGYKAGAVGYGESQIVTILYRIMAALSSASGYIVGGVLQDLIIVRVMPEGLLGQGMAIVVTVFLNIFVNSLESVYRNAHNDDRALHAVGWFAYGIDFTTIAISMMLARGFHLGWLPFATGRVALTWFDLLLVVILSILLTWGPEPLLEYAFTGHFKLFGKRF